MKPFSTLAKAFLGGIIILASTNSFGQITSPTANSTTLTAYTNGAPNNNIYMFCVPNQSTTDIASLTANAPSGTAPFTFNWSLFNSGTYSFDAYTTTTGANSTINNIPTGGYFVSIVDAGGNAVGCYTAWVFNNRSFIDVANIPSSCASFQLNGTANPVANFVYYNPPAVDKMIINASTTITVCFNATHTYVSDLGFYLVSPCGQTIPLSPNPGAIGQGTVCNSGDNVNNLCFTTASTTNLNVCSPSPASLSGTYGTYGSPATAINWSPLYGCDAAQGGWKVQIYDCINQDFGALTRATITFTGSTPCGIKTINYNSGAINSTINDNSCTAALASNFVVPPVNPSPISFPTPNSITSFQWTSNNPCVTIPNATTSLTPTISPVPTSNTWFYLTATDNMGCTQLRDSALFVSSCPCPISALTKNVVPCTGPNTFTINGQVTFSNPPCSGQLIVQTCSGAQQVFNAPFTSPINYSLTGITADGTAGCTVTANFTNGPAACTFSTPAFTEPVPVNVIITPPAAVCAPATVDLTAPAVTAGSTTGGTLSYWTNAAGTVALGSPGAVAASGTYYIMNTVGACSDIKPVVVTVNPTPVATPVTNIVVCAGATVPVSAYSSTPTGATFAWTSSNPAIGTGASGNTNLPSFTATNATAAPITATITVTPSIGSCTGAPITYTITVNPLPVVGVNSPTICNGQTATLTGTGAANYSWDTGSTANPINVSPTVTTSYIVTGTTANCSATATATVTVNPLPSVTVPANIADCAGATIPASTFTSTPGGASFNWTNSDGTIGLATSGTLSVPSFTAINSTAAPIISTITVTPTLATCVGTPSTYTITINPIPVIGVNSESVCPGQAAVLTATGGTNYSWDTGSTANPLTVTPAATTSYVVTGTTAGCSATATATVTVGSSIVAGVNSPTICNGQSATLMATGGTNYSWNTGEIIDSIIVSPTVTTSYIVTVTTGFCSGTATATVTVNPLPSTTVLANITVCNGDAIAGTLFTSNPAGAAFDWTNTNTAIGISTAAGNGDIAAFTGSNTTADPDTATITVTATANLCTGPPSTYTIVVNPTPTVTVPANIVICNGGNIPATAFTSPVTGTTYAWTNSDPTIGIAGGGIGDVGAFTATNTTAAPVTATITVTPSANGCTGTVSTYTITVNPTATVTVPANIVICNGGSIPATAFTSPVTGTTFAWTNSDPTIGIGASGIGDIGAFTATNTTSAPVTATITVTPSANSCTGTPSTYTITINPTPAAPTAAGASVCINNATTLTATAPGGIYDWYDAAGGGVLLAGNSAVYTTPVLATSTTYYVQTTINNCVSAFTPVVVNIAPGLVVDAGLNDTICFGGSTGLIVTPNGAAYTYIWSPAAGLGGGTTLYNPTANPSVTTTYSVTVTDTAGCVGTDSVTIYSDPQINLAIAGLPASCHGSCDGQAIVIPSGGSGAFPSYIWSGGCITPACSHCAGNDTVLVTDSWGCTATNNTMITEPTALTASTTQVNTTCFAGCNGTATITPAGGSPAPAGYNYSWNTSPVQTTATATGLCAGTYICTVTDANNCSLADASTTVTITEPTQVILTPVPDVTICTSGSTTLSTTASGGSGTGYQYVWTPATDLSDDSISNPVASPLTTTIYTVNATDANGCVAPSQTVTVTVNPPLSVATFGAASVCPGSATTIYATPSNGNGGLYSIAWSPTTGLSAPANDTTSAMPGTTTTFTVTVTDGCSPAVTGTVTVTVLPLPAPVFSSNITSGCVPLCVNFTDASTISSGSVSGWGWDFNDGLPATGNTATHCFTMPGSYSITLSDTSAAGCVSTVTYANMITVNPIPVPGFTAPLSTSIVNPIVTFTDNSIGANQWQWNFGDLMDPLNNTSTQSDPTHTFSEVGTYCVQQTVISNAGCKDSITICVVIDPEFTFYIPNAFSPDGDGINDEFYGKGDFVYDFNMSIYDRWGNLIFITDDINKHWDGKANHGSEIAQVDTYVYVITLRDNKGTGHKYIGGVTIVK